MSRRRAPRSPRAWSWVLTLRLRSQSSSASSCLKRTQRRRARAERKLTLLLLTVDSTHLRVKELEELEDQLRHRQAEMAQALAFRTQKVLPALPPPDPEQREVEQILFPGSAPSTPSR